MYVLMIGHPKKIEQLEQDPPEIVIKQLVFLSRVLLYTYTIVYQSGGGFNHLEKDQSMGRIIPYNYYGKYNISETTNQ